MYVWTIEGCEECKDLLQEAMTNSMRPNHFQKVYHVLNNMQSSKTLKDLFHAVLQHAVAKKDLSSHVEMLAALEYNKRNIHAGKLRLLSSICTQNAHTRPALAYMQSWCRRARRKGWHLEANFWFRARVMLMDVYSLAHVFSTKRGELCIFYGGESHATTLRHVLEQHGAKTTRVRQDVVDYTRDKDLTSVRAYTLDGRQIIVVGENHSQTKTSFGSEFVKLLRSWCHLQTKVTCLVEKHVFVKDDTVQRTLTCNMPHLAIHRFRCDDFLDTHTCSNMHIVPVDNRHYDLGFLRYEVFLLWHKCPTFRRVAIKFHSESLHQLHAACGRMIENIDR